MNGPLIILQRSCRGLSRYPRKALRHRLRHVRGEETQTAPVISAYGNHRARSREGEVYGATGETTTRVTSMDSLSARRACSERAGKGTYSRIIPLANQAKNRTLKTIPAQ